MSIVDNRSCKVSSEWVEKQPMFVRMDIVSDYKQIYFRLPLVFRAIRVISISGIFHVFYKQRGSFGEERSRRLRETVYVRLCSQKRKWLRHTVASDSVTSVGVEYSFDAFFGGQFKKWYNSFS